MQEQELLEKIRTGDSSVFKEIFEAYKTLVFNVCFRMLGNPQEAEDLTQDVFIKAYKSLKKFRYEAKLSTWLYKISINLCLNHQRRKKQARWLSLDVIFESQGIQTSSSIAASENGSDVMLEKSEIEHIIRNAINSLSKKQRIALILQRYEGLSYKEIADVMHCSVSSVESRLHQAKQNLYKRLFPLLKEL